MGWAWDGPADMGAQADRRTAHLGELCCAAAVRRLVVGACELWWAYDENETKRNPKAATQAQPRDAELSSPGIYSNENRQEAVVVF